MEFLKEKEYKLLADSEYFDKNGHLQKTNKVKLFALKFCDRDILLSALREDNQFGALKILTEKGYIVPIQEGKLKIDNLDFRIAVVLLEEYSESFLDISPFLPKK
jgi:hypothetical protein